MITETIAVPEIHCDHCKTSIEGAVRVLEGVQTVDVAIDARTVTVEYDGAAIDRAAITAAIEDQGYEVPA